MNKEKYYFVRIGRNWHIYLGSKRVASEPPCFTFEEARRRVYELNGWKYKPLNTNRT